MTDPKAETNSPITRRYDFILLFDVTNGNPNGDPDAGNSPRIDPETGHGLVSDVCLKRKIRNFVCLAKNDPNTGKPADGYDIYVKEKAILNRQHQRAYEALGLKTDEEAKKCQDKARAWMCQTFFDVRMFGAVMSTGKNEPRKNCGQVRGPVQFAFARSVDRISPLPQTITRVAITTEEKAQEQIEKRGSQSSEMGSKEIVPYALYAAHGFISPHLAADTGFSQADLDLLWQALKMMFEVDRSAARGEMSSCKLLVFEHESLLGNAPAHALFDRVKITRKDLTRPARAFSDYEVANDKANLPSGITMHEML
jgi:CRISPR-associated protein Csd2